MPVAHAGSKGPLLRDSQGFSVQIFPVGTLDSDIIDAAIVSNHGSDDDLVVPAPCARFWLWHRDAKCATEGRADSMHVRAWRRSKYIRIRIGKRGQSLRDFQFLNTAPGVSDLSRHQCSGELKEITVLYQLPRLALQQKSAVLCINAEFIVVRLLPFHGIELDAFRSLSIDAAI